MATIFLYFALCFIYIDGFIVIGVLIIFVLIGNIMNGEGLWRDIFFCFLEIVWERNVGKFMDKMTIGCIEMYLFCINFR